MVGVSAPRTHRRVPEAFRLSSPLAAWSWLLMPYIVKNRTLRPRLHLGRAVAVAAGTALTLVPPAAAARAEPAAPPVVTYGGDWSETVSGQIQAGRSLVVRY